MKILYLFFAALLTAEATDSPFNLRGRELGPDTHGHGWRSTAVVAVELGDDGWHKISVPMTKEHWAMDNGAMPNCEGKYGYDLKNHQMRGRSFCCQFDNKPPEICTIQVPRKMKDWVLDTGDVTLHKCGKKGNAKTTTPVELQFEYIEPCHSHNLFSWHNPADTVELCVPLGGNKGDHLMVVDKKKKKWFLDNGALKTNSCETGKELTKRQKRMVNFCCEFDSEYGGETCNVKAPSGATKFMVKTDGATVTRHKCGHNMGNPAATTSETLKFGLV